MNHSTFLRKLSIVFFLSSICNFSFAQEELEVSSGTTGDAWITIESDTDNSNEGDNAYMQFKQDGGIVGAYIGFNQNWGTGTESDNIFRIGTRRSGIDSYNRLVINTLSGNIGIGHDNPTDGKLHVYQNATLGNWGSINTSNATLRIEDSGANMYLDGNSIYADALMNIGTIGNHNLTFGTDNTRRMTILDNGNVGIGVSNPSERLEVNGTVLSDNLRTDQNNTKYSQIIRNGNGTALYVNQVASNKPIMRLSSGSAAANEGVKFSVESTGATRIGMHQIPSGYMLAVDGKAIMTEVKVAVTPWPDYVFTPSYDLQSLDQVETFINENGHLPNIPSAQEVEENNGIELGEMNAKLLEKIEELTLHLIEKDKEVKKLESTLEDVLGRLEKLENE